MARLFRVATPNDYTYNKKLQCYELSFDKRPIQGTICDNPIEGSIQYNAARKKFLDAWNKSLPQGNDLSLINFIDWVINNNNRESIKYAILMLSASNIDEYLKTVLRFLNSSGCTTKKFDLMLYFFGFEQRLKIPLDKRLRLERLYNG